MFGEESGTAWFRRRFHDPTGLGPEERVVIALPNAAGEFHDICLNQASIPATDWNPLRYDVTARLIGFNELTFGITFDPLNEPGVLGGLWEAVFVEIHSIADRSGR